jgi:hypothetical protein
MVSQIAKLNIKTQIIKSICKYDNNKNTLAINVF